MRVLLFDAESVSDIDSTAMIAMRDPLEAEGIELWTARMKTRVHDQIERVDGLEPGRVFPTVRAALEAFQDLPVQSGQEEPTPDGDAEGLDNADSDQENH